MDAILTAIASTIGTEALKAWGSYAIALIVLGWMLWRGHVRETRLQEENATLRIENTSLRDKRLEDVQKMIGVTENSTALQQARTQGDQVFLKALLDIVDEMSALRTSKDGLAGNRQLLEELIAIVDQQRSSRLGGARRSIKDRDSR